MCAAVGLLCRGPNDADHRCTGSESQKRGSEHLTTDHNKYPRMDNPRCGTCWGRFHGRVLEGLWLLCPPPVGPPVGSPCPRCRSMLSYK